MFHRSCPVAILALVLALTAASAQQAPNNPTPSPAIPDTPAGHTFKAWFDSFNSGERASIDAYRRQWRYVHFDAAGAGFCAGRSHWKSSLELQIPAWRRGPTDESRRCGC